MKFSAVVRTLLISGTIILGGFLANSAQAASVPRAGVKLLKLSSDPYTNPSSQHKTEVSPASFSFGSTIVAAFEAGVFSDGGNSNIGWATSTDNGTTWKKGFLPGTTVYAKPAGPYVRITNPAVAYDAKHNTWLILSLGIDASLNAIAVLASRSTNGGLTWSTPGRIYHPGGGPDFYGDALSCDNAPSSAFYGNCYPTWDDKNGNPTFLMYMSVSKDGGLTWGAPTHTANLAAGQGARVLVQPSGTVIVAADNANESAILAFTSTNGGGSWSSTVTANTITTHAPGGLDAPPLISASISDTMVFVTWYDCRFESGCSANDIVMITSTDGTTWTAATRVPFDPVGSGKDHVLPGISTQTINMVTPQTCTMKSSHARGPNCIEGPHIIGFLIWIVVVIIIVVLCEQDPANCTVEEDGISSANGGTTWSSSQQLSSAMNPTWWANTNAGYTLGDHLSGSISSAGKFFPILPVATVPKQGKLNEAIYTVNGGLS